MKKDLSGMSLKELWELFPVILKEHNPLYKEWYESEVRLLSACISKDDMKRVSHIGSSAVEGLISKPIVDILMEVGNNCHACNLIKNLKNNGWRLMSSRYEPVFHLVFNKGYTENGYAEKVYHLHVRHIGDWDELYFIDYLGGHPDVASLYGKLKLKLGKDYEHDRDGYTEAKKEFIMRHTEKAKVEYAGRYSPQ